MIRVVDAICGAGKTTWVFDHIRTNSDKRWLFVSPYLSEVGDGKTKGRIQLELPELDFKAPGTSSLSKSSHLKNLLTAGHNIACTHALFEDIDKDTVQIIYENGYHLIIDETMDMIEVWKEYHPQDITALAEAGMINITESGRVEWNHIKYPNYKGRDLSVKNKCDTGSLWLYGDSIFIARTPPCVIDAAKTATILTYLFEGSLMAAWLKVNKLSYTPYYPEGLRPEKEIKHIIKSKLNIINTPKKVLDIQRDSKGMYAPHTFSYSWFESADSELLKALGASLENTRQKGMSKGPYFWTAPIGSNPYQQLKVMTHKRWQTDLENKDGSKHRTFVPWNTRATNDFAERTNCIYAYNVYPNVSIVQHYKTLGIEVDAEKYALGYMLQFIFRGSIRTHDPMSILVASERMKIMLENWLEI
ncbi:hypothetical protein PS726_00459 [Pseudomonas fluorescens]|uniref:hypothetical protein n=1 Tax=Pseudomonas fluorescens TaxID=294 RepID=UPI00123F59F1|nr:hypothetical protein [Pseudomonas fluorescens]VVN71705.1 hypothetical protein PS726_00459 [Pseudomonas fluorescens]